MSAPKEYLINRQVWYSEGIRDGECIGKICVKCGSNRRYIKSGKCTDCQRKRNVNSRRDRFVKKNKIKDSALKADSLAFDIKLKKEIKEVWDE